MKSPILISLLGLAACVTPPKIAPVEMRQKVYSIDNNKSKNENFDKLQVWAAKASNNVKLNDRASGTIVIGGNVDCDVLKMNKGYATNQYVTFKLELKVSDKNVRVAFEDLLAESPGAYDHLTRPSNQEEVDKVVAECIDPLKKDIQAAL